MSKTAKIWIIVAAVVVVVIIALAGVYNGLVASREGVDAQWAQVETQYQRRFDLIPNLVESVKGVLKQEQTVFGELARARANYAGARTSEEKVAAANQLETGLSRLLVIMENYPQLKSAETVQTLMVQLEGTENRVSVERGRYNDAVRFYNIKVKTFPTNLIAGVFGFAPRAMFEAVTAAKEAPAVKLEIK